MYTSHALIKEKAIWYCLLGASKDTPIESISGIITAPNAPRGAPFSRAGCCKFFAPFVNWPTSSSYRDGPHRLKARFDILSKMVRNRQCIPVHKLTSTRTSPLRMVCRNTKCMYRACIVSSRCGQNVSFLGRYTGMYCRY